MKKVFLIGLFSASALFAKEPQIILESEPALLVTNIQVVVLSGSQTDPIDKVGVSNMVGELMLRGTKKRTRDKFQAEIERMGASLSVRTAQDMIVFDGRVIKENTDAFIALLEDCLLYPKFLKKEFDSLKTELLAEAAHIKNANNRLGGLTARKELFAGSSLEKPVNGTLGSLKKIQLDDVVRTYNNALHRGNVVFGVASSVPEAKLKTALTNIWQKLPDGAKLTQKNIVPKVPESPKLIVIHKPKTSTGSLLFAQAGITAQDPDRYTLSTGNFSYGGEPLVSRLFRTIRGELGWTYAIGSTYGAMGPLSYQQGIYIVSSTPSVEFTTKTILKTLEMWKDFYDKGLNSDELKLAQESLVNSYPFEFDSAGKRLSQRMSSLIYSVPILSQDEYDNKISDIGNSDVKKALLARHKPSSWLIALVADKDVFEKQLAEEQKDIPEAKRLKIAKVVTPDQVVE